jgi:hypothetical protein
MHTHHAHPHDTHTRPAPPAHACQRTQPNKTQAHAQDSDAREAARLASEGLRQQRMTEMSTTGSMVTLSSLATMDEDVDTLQVGGARQPPAGAARGWRGAALRAAQALRVRACRCRQVALCGLTTGGRVVAHAPLTLVCRRPRCPSPHSLTLSVRLTLVSHSA